MSFDDDMKNRFAQQAPVVSNLDAGAAAAASSAKRRTTAGRGIAAIAIFAFIGLGALGLASRGDANSLDVAGDPEAEGTTVPIDDEQDPEQTSEESEEIRTASTEGPDESDRINVSTTASPSPEVTSDDASTPTTASPDEPPVSGPETTLPAFADGGAFRVVNVESNDTLNARSGPGTAFDVVFELAPDALGVVRTVDTQPDFVDGSVWVEIYGPVSGIRGWVNGSFIEEVDVLDDSPCVFDELQGSTADSFTNNGGSAASEAAVVTAMDTFRFGSCIRTVLEFSDGFNSSNDPADRVSSLPTDITITGDTFDGISIINFGPSIIAAEAADAFLTEDAISQSTFLFRQDSGNLAGFVYGPSSTIDVTFDNTNGRIIIDVADTRAATAAVQPLLIENGVVVTDAFSGPDGVVLSGFARPFEAVLDVEVLLSNSPIDVEWTGALIPGATSTNGVMTTDWSSAWGAFDFTIEAEPSVNVFDLVVRIDPTGGAADNPVTVDLILEDLLN